MIEFFFLTHSLNHFHQFNSNRQKLRDSYLNVCVNNETLTYDLQRATNLTFMFIWFRKPRHFIAVLCQTASKTLIYINETSARGNSVDVVKFTWESANNLPQIFESSSIRREMKRETSVYVSLAILTRSIFFHTVEQFCYVNHYF